MTPSSYLLLACLVPAIAFVAVYATLPWYRFPPGRSVMNLAVAIVLALTVPLTRDLYGDPPWRETYRAVVFAWVLVALWAQFIVLVRESFCRSRGHAHRREQEATRETEEVLP